MYNCNLRALREYNQVSQQKLADALGVSRQTINTIENERSIPKIDLALKIAKYFEVDVNLIFQI